MPTRKRYRCRLCGGVLNAWLPWANGPNGALLLGHLGQAHPDQVGPYLRHMEACEGISTVAAEAYDVGFQEQVPENIW